MVIQFAPVTLNNERPYISIDIVLAALGGNGFNYFQGYETVIKEI